MWIALIVLAAIYVFGVVCLFPLIVLGVVTFKYISTYDDEEAEFDTSDEVVKIALFFAVLWPLYPVGLVLERFIEVGQAWKNRWSW